MNATFGIGVSGHQVLGDQNTIEFVAEKFRELLLTYQAWASQQQREVVLYSALAVGSDRLFVRIATEMNIPVEIVLPCAHYDEIFSAEDKEEYYKLLSLAKVVHHLPIEKCSDDAFLSASQWIVDHADLVIVAWNGYPAAGRSGTADTVSYARMLRRPFIHIHTRLHTTKLYGSLSDSPEKIFTPRREFAISKQTVYQGSVLAVNRYHFQMPHGKEIIRDIVERPESVLILPVGQKDTVLLIEEYDLGAGVWQYTLPGGKVTDSIPENILQQAELELREETGYRPGKLEKLISLYGHPGYVAHKVHIYAAFDLEWDPLELENQEEIHVCTLTLDEALAATREDFRCDPEAALAIWLYSSRLP